jgi:hypothetical protein
MAGSPEFEALYEQCVLIAYDRQMHLNEAVHGSWDLEQDTGLLTFSHDDQRFVTPVQMLGTQSAVDGTWLWSWANDMSQTPTDQLTAAAALRSFGEQNNVPELREPMIEADGHRLAMVAVGLTKLPGYYRCPYEGGAAFVLMVHPDSWQAPELPVVRMANLLGYLIEQVELANPIRSLVSWGHAYGLQEEASNGALRLVSEHGDALEIRLTDTQKIVGIETHIEPRQAAGT